MPEKQLGSLHGVVKVNQFQFELTGQVTSCIQVRLEDNAEDCYLIGTSTGYLEMISKSS